MSIKPSLILTLNTKLIKSLKEVIFFNSSSFTQPVLIENINKHFEDIVDIVLMNQYLSSSYY